MTGTTVQIGIEIGLVLLLAATLLRAWRLDRALGELRRDRGALGTLVEGFRGATESAEQSVARLRQAGTETGRDLARRIEHAGALREDLGFITQRAEAAADRLEQLVRESRSPVPAATAPRGLAEPPPHETHRYETHPHETRRPETNRRDAHPQEPPERPRSAAERDLLRALKLVR